MKVTAVLGCIVALSLGTMAAVVGREDRAEEQGLNFTIPKMDRFWGCMWCLPGGRPGMSPVCCPLETTNFCCGPHSYQICAQKYPDDCY